MTAQMFDDLETHGPLWFFTTRSALIANDLGNGRRVIATFCSRCHDVFATVHGSIRIDNSRRAIDRLWNAEIAAWYGESGKDDPQLTLLRLDAERAQVWIDGRDFLTGVKLLFGGDPKAACKQQSAEIELQ